MITNIEQSLTNKPLNNLTLKVAKVQMKERKNSESSVTTLLRVGFILKVRKKFYSKLILQLNKTNINKCVENIKSKN